jgi:heme/copper-type cytochrome/quinol oxidase subunit 4
MTAQLLNRATGVWLALTLATAASWSLAENHLAGRLTVAMILLLAAFKVRLVFLNFMELRTAAPPWRVIFEIWIVACTVLIWGFHAYAPG